jgi:hypothetical protein
MKIIRARAPALFAPSLSISEIRVGDTLKCLIYVDRKDHRSNLNPGDTVKVTHAFAFTCGAKQCQEIVVQKDHDAPIAVLVKPGRFEHISPDICPDTTKKQTPATS